MSGPCLSSSVADRPLRPATRLRLGGPLPRQLADRPQAPPKTPSQALVQLTCVNRPHQVLIRVSPSYPCLWGRLLTCYAPVRSSTYCYAFVLARLACLNHAASVHSEPESNSPYKISYILSEKINPFSLRISTSILGLFLLSIKSSLRIRPRRHMRRFAQSYLVNISQRTLPLHLFWKRPPIKNPFL